MVEYTKRRKFDGVICGHIHTPEIKMIDGIQYMNCGDYVESCSALVEKDDGTWDIIYWHNMVESDAQDNISNNG